MRLLMQHGADARKGIYPHRDATSALTLATDRGYDEIVAVIREEEQRRSENQSGGRATAAPEDCSAAETWRSGRALEILRANPALAQSANPEGWTPLHAAASLLDETGIAWLLDHAADPNRLAKARWTPLDIAASGRGWGETGTPAKFESVAPSPAQPRHADGSDRHAESALTKPTGHEIFGGVGGLLSIAVRRDRAEMLALLLDLGFDPDERMRVAGMDEIV